jgi:hypothetical protein
MEATELRIGNLVSLNGKEFKVTLQSLYEGANLDFKPLKLTENRPNHFQKDEYTMNTHIFWDCNGMFIDDKNGVYVKYVHQLQNLYFALQQKELTTK